MWASARRHAASAARPSGVLSRGHGTGEGYPHGMVWLAFGLPGRSGKPDAVLVWPGVVRGSRPGSGIGIAGPAAGRGWRKENGSRWHGMGRIRMETAWIGHS